MSIIKTKSEILGLYRKILRLGQTWEAKNPVNNQYERSFIKEEARTLFHKNMNAPPEMIPHKIFEAETRIELALHYQIPYPRLPFIQKGVDFSALSSQEVDAFQQDHRPAYMHSYFNDHSTSSPKRINPAPSSTVDDLMY